jgi:tetratricopeptide (TPR) repeat protein
VSEKYPDEQSLLASLGYYQVMASQYEPAIKTYEKILAKEPDSHDAHMRLGLIYTGLSNTEKAREHYEKAVQLDPNDVSTMGSLAKIYQDVGETDRSLAMYERAATAATGEEAVKLKSQLGRLYIEKKDFEKSAKTFEDLVAAEPDKPAHRFNLGISYFQNKAYDRAAVQFEKATELKPDFGEAYQYLAMSYNETNQANKAIDAAKKGINVAENKGGLYCAWGKSLEKLKLYDEAIVQFEKATGDPQWGDYARKQIKRQSDLKKRAEAMREQQGG